MLVEVLKVEQIQEYDYELRTESCKLVEGEKPTNVVSAYTSRGEYVGDKNEAYFLYAERGIIPELRTQESRVCSIGFCKREQKWYGWSHRSMHGFGIGDEIKTDDLGATASLPIGFKSTSLSDSKRMAVAFAEAVS